MPSLACRYYDPPGLWCRYCRNANPARCIDRRAVPENYQPLTGRAQPAVAVEEEAELGPLPWILGCVACVAWGATLAYLTRGDWLPCLLALTLAVAASLGSAWSLARAAGSSEVQR